ncbi:hypothetical protein ABJI51_33290 [Amycolatopsis sp. NEAU-NG30]|uniref:SMODS and SLOG-associating 2TM effector domain-containing protein n=1 Tax=Amycolatopsis melonis TaxID=3156488 RepID=A0ABV0LNX7_9PSEU
MNGWTLALILYPAVAAGSFAPVGRVLLKGVDLHPGGPSFDESPHFSEEARKLLEQHFERLRGTLGYWKTQASKYKAFHTYCLVWITLATASVPFLSQAITDDAQSKWLLTIVGAHAAILLAFSRAFRVENNYKAFRHGESEFYDLYRRLLDRPRLFGQTEQQQLAAYFEQVEIVRRSIRASETDNFPSVEEIAPVRPANGGDSAGQSASPG